MSSQRNTKSDGAPANAAGAPAAPAAVDPVLVAARDVIMEQGTSRATLTEVARRAGVSRMTVYRRFATWDRIVSTLLTVELAQLLAEVEASAPVSVSERERAVAAMMALTRALGNHDLLRRVAEVDPQSLVPLLTRRFGQTQLAARAHLAEILIAGMATRGGDGSVRDEDPQIMSMTSLLMCQSYTLAAPAIEQEPDSEALYSQLVFALRAYLSPTPTESLSPTATTNPELAP